VSGAPVTIFEFASNLEMPTPEQYASAMSSHEYPSRLSASE